MLRRKAKLFGLILVMILSGAACTAGQQAGGRQQRAIESKDQRPPAEIVALINDARSVPAEFNVDTLLRLVESNKIADQRWKLEIIEEAFRLASGARQPIKRKALPGGLVDSRSGYLALAFDLNLDALSLQCRAVRAMLTVDKQKARELFKEISNPKLPPLSCDEALVYDVSDFYDTLNKIALTTFSQEEIGRDEDVRFVGIYMERLSSPAQFNPVANTVLSIATSASRLEMLAHDFSAALKNISGDDRSFSFSLMEEAFGRNIRRFVEACKQYNVSRSELLEAVRVYLIKHLRDARCVDNLVAQERDYINRNAVGYINKLLLEIDPSKKNLAPVLVSEIEPSKVDNSARIFPHWESLESKRLLFKVKELRFGSSSKPLTALEKDTAEWQAKLRGFINDLADWDSRTEKSEADYFHQKSNLFMALLEIVPAGPLQDTVIVNFVAFLRQPVIQQDNRIEWFLHVNELVQIARSARLDTRAKILDALSNSDNSILKLYSSVENLLTASSKRSNQML